MTTRKRRDDETQDAPDEDDTALFRRVLNDVRPLAPRDYHEPLPPGRPARARLRRRDDAAVLDESLDVDVETLEADAGDALRYSRPSVGRRTMRKLARGNYAVQAEIDLHGMTAAEAQAALAAFIAESVRRGHGCVRVIHGKGRGSGSAGPVLKPRVDRWLRRWNDVLAFVSARPNHGGTGAVYVLLRT